MNFGVHMDPNRVHMEGEGRPNGGLGAKHPEKGPFGPYWTLLALLALWAQGFLLEKNSVGAALYSW